MSTESEKKIVLKAIDGVTFEVTEAVAKQSETIAHLIEDDCTDNGVPLDNVKGNILAKVIEYCKKHVVDADESSLTENEKGELKKWDTEFVKLDQSTIFDLILAANYLSIKNLLELTCQTIADQIAACEDPHEIRAKFGIVNDFTADEEAAVLRENRWAFE